MSRSKMFISAVLLFATLVVHAQDDSTRYIHGLPVSEDDTATQFPRRDFQPQNKILPLPPYRLPDEVREALKTEEQYKGWRDTVIYFEENTGLYLVPIKYSEGVKIFGLNENGNPVTYDEVRKSPE
jgi:hypothetical protein